MAEERCVGQACLCKVVKAFRSLGGTPGAVWRALCPQSPSGPQSPGPPAGPAAPSVSHRRTAGEKRCAPGLLGPTAAGHTKGDRKCKITDRKMKVSVDGLACCDLKIMFTLSNLTIWIQYWNWIKYTTKHTRPVSGWSAATWSVLWVCRLRPKNLQI